VTNLVVEGLTWWWRWLRRTLTRPSWGTRDTRGQPGPMGRN